MEAYYINDSIPVVAGDAAERFDGEFIVFDIETTGLSAAKERITEIGAVRVKNGEVLEVSIPLSTRKCPSPPRSPS